LYHTGVLIQGQGLCVWIPCTGTCTGTLYGTECDTYTVYYSTYSTAQYDSRRAGFSMSRWWNAHLRGWRSNTAMAEQATVAALPQSSANESNESNVSFQDGELDEKEGEIEEKIATVPPSEYAVPANHDVLLPAVVTVDRKEFLLQQARENRLAWIQSVPLPYSTAESTVLDATHILPELPSATKILSLLYGCCSNSSNTKEIAARLDDLISKQDPAGRRSALRNAEEWLDDERRAAADGDDSIRILLSDYRAFLEQLGRPESAVVVNTMRHALSQTTTSTGGDPATALRNQVASTLEQLKRIDGHEAWTTRSLESFLYGQASGVIQDSLTNERKRDQELLVKMQMLDFVTAKHLDLTCFEDDNHTYLAPAVSTLLAVQSYYSPYEKLQCILKTYHCINSALVKAQGGKIPSADDVLPTLIWVVLQAKPPSLISNLAMIETYAPPEYLRGEAGYAFTNLYGAVQFLVDLNLDQNETEPMTSLTMTAQEFRLGLEKSRVAMEAQVGAAIQQKELLVPTVEFAKSVDIPVSEVRAARLRGEVVDLDWAKRRFLTSSETTQSGERTSEEQILPTGFSRSYSFLTTRPDELRLKDLPLLLAEYKMLVRTTETLLAERSHRASQERKERLVRAEMMIHESAIEAELEFLASGRLK
jgi:hypothetical protein